MRKLVEIIESQLNKQDQSGENVLVKIGDFKLTKHDLDVNFKDNISNHYGEYNEDSINNALWTLYDIEKLYNNGGNIYRVIWLDSEDEFDKNDLGTHWLANKGDISSIVSLFSIRDDKSGDPYYIKAYTPPKNVSIPDDYFNNLDENEVMVIDSKILKDVELFKFTQHVY